MKKSSKNSINRIFSPFIKAIRAFDSALISLRKDNDGVYTSREEKITVFAISYVLAMILWMVVNLNGSYSINVDVPLAVGTIPQGMALVDAIPEEVQAEINGEGWKLISLKSNPPSVPVDITSGEIDVFSQVRQRFAPEQDVTVIDVSPLRLRLDLEPSIRKQLPLRWSPKIQYADRYGRLGEGSLEPDSIWVQGAESKIRDLQEWTIQSSMSFDNVRSNVTVDIPVTVQDPSISVDLEQVRYTEEVAQFTEGELVLVLRTRNIPRGQRFNFSPSTITVQYRVPIDEYAEAQESRTFEAYIDYRDIRGNTTGVVQPVIQQLNQELNIELKSFRPQAVSYFSVINE
ncbi:MAG: hypothetical protein VW868_01195 [Bacteroidota bacterium]|jgi:hypothetical protein